MFAALAKNTEESDSEKEAIEESAWGRYPSTSCVLTAIGKIQCHLILSRSLLLKPTGTWGDVMKIILIKY